MILSKTGIPFWLFCQIRIILFKDDNRYISRDFWWFFSLFAIYPISGQFVKLLSKLGIPFWAFCQTFFTKSVPFLVFWQDNFWISLYTKGFKRFVLRHFVKVLSKLHTPIEQICHYIVGLALLALVKRKIARMVCESSNGVLNRYMIVRSSLKSYEAAGYSNKRTSRSNRHSPYLLLWI